jgi:2-oxoglutarate dehydrogenase E2 component (dihydrolipoamide succinyltransferase)
MAEELTMPALGIAMTEGLVLEWMVDEGEAFEEGEALVRIETDKAQTDVVAPFAGVLLEHLAAEETEVPVGGPIASLRRAE